MPRVAGHAARRAGSYPMQLILPYRGYVGLKIVMYDLPQAAQAAGHVYQDVEAMTEW